MGKPARKTRKGLHQMSDSTTDVFMPARTNRSDATAQPRADVENSLALLRLDES